MKEKKQKSTKKEGRKLKTIEPMNRVAPYIMKTRGDATNFISDTLDITEAEEYIFKKRQEGLASFGLMHVFLAAFVRMISQHPEMNRFIRGQRIYARNCVEVMITIKREMRIDAPETVLKLFFPREATAEEVYNIVTQEIEKYRNNHSDFDETAKMLNYIPGLLLKSTVWFLNFLDYFGLLPRKLTRLSPFHGSFAITSMGSLGIPPIYHHLYNFGNIPIFFAFGVKYNKNELKADGTVKSFKCVDYRITTDERIADGYAYAAALKHLKSTMKHPDSLDLPPKTVIEDIK